MFFEVDETVYLYGPDLDGENQGRTGKVKEVCETTLIVELEFSASDSEDEYDDDDDNRVEVSKENCICLGKCEGCGAWGVLGNLCGNCEDTGYIYSEI